MHELLAELFPWIVVLYAVDGLAQLGRGHLVFTGGLGPSRLRRAGLHLLGLSPLDEAIAAHDLPYLVSSQALHLFDPRRRSDPALIAAADLEACPFEAVAPVSREGRKVTFAGRTAVAAPTPEWAERVRADVSALAATPAERRVAAERATRRERLDVAAVRSLRDRQRAFVPAIRAAAVLLFAGTFVAWPLAAYDGLGLALPAGALLAALGGLVCAVAVLSGLMLAACGEPVWRSVSAALHLALYPVSALRPLVHAPRGLYHRFDAAAIAAALLPRDVFGGWAAREIRRARLSRTATAPELAACWEERERDLASLLASVGLAEAEALAPPRQLDGAAAWCPLCGGQYRAGFRSCADCGVDLEPFTATARSAGP